ncbi:MAG: methylenetetrahydrofolate reductase [Apilactobacillus sp.]|uniref:methylenetetrahydrofolate reductase n=1 Tax=Apilactobacillus sp. TaxID=2767901 RepID=UPI0025FF8892|nr:methylenetetrahydrofolate reductase [Apilactobacillus sp.]MCT6823044.1 methylenetetrahydrofolate reductase [Apilactobacillus sp.]MCT6858475.1 methylenetetrahydrofolate reductase [Apilactobacillus sp.]
MPLQYSFEITPNIDQDNLDGLLTLHPQFISITDRNHDMDNLIQSIKIADYVHAHSDVDVMIHLTGIDKDYDTVKQMMDLMQNHDVNDVLALRGDKLSQNDSAIIFSHADELVEFIKKEYQDVNIAGTCYLNSNDEELHWLKHKVTKGCTNLISQFSFDVNDYVDYLNRTDVTTPIWFGIMPVISKTQTQKMLDLTHATTPDKIIALMNASEEEFGEKGVIYTAEMINKLEQAGANHIHLYSLNDAENTKQIIEQI